jgi:hypothetical protein
MGMTRGTALVASLEDVAKLTGQAHLDNLNETGELALDDLLLTASDAIYDRLDADGIDPTKLTNPEVFRRVVAWHFLALLAALGHFSAGEGERSQEFYDRFMGLSDRYYADYTKPRLTGGDSPSRAGVGTPTVGNILPRSAFGGCNVNPRPFYNPGGC